MFTHHGKKEKPVRQIPLTDLNTIVSFEAILSEEKRATLVANIKEACILDPQSYKAFCDSLLINLVNHCQLLPESEHNYYTQAGGFLDYALNRTEIALNLFRQFVVLEENQTTWSEEQSLWQYALYSAALLQGIGKLCVDFQVKCYDKKGQLLNLWNPLLKALVSEATYYSYSFEKEVEQDFRRRINLLMARRLMPENGYAWIASNRDVLTVWLALLNEDFYSAGTLGAILIRADALALRRYFAQLLAHTKHARQRATEPNQFSDKKSVPIQVLENKIGAQFIEWLAKSLESGQIMINKAPLLSVPGGLLISPQTLQLFMRAHHEYKSWSAVQAGVLSLGLHWLGPQGEANLRAAESGTQKMHEGFVLPLALLLQEEANEIQTSNGKTMRLSALETLQQAYKNPSFNLETPLGSSTLLHLSAAGKWQLPPVIATFLAGASPRGR